ncbi:DUF5590 domain-containing protein [Ornithinibacillus sp. BX22]|uniref:DUF5590 domain-containing protein n=2 Tax=Ornithinibacillus TaxID=484508 RepID=A0A923L5X4_9BACI|nr:MULTISPECIES: DUF5590 domain-containing protein [Ornithinibacillus]MBC5637049.1 DUF5590 domain-containing protein [Ornithinibacillus hominis]MBS3679740.1 DUF5590 domain-containing protein [Ornithinibacillus massiliensis]
MRRNNINAPSWTKWVIFALIIVVVAILIFLSVLYNNIEKSKTNGFENAEKRVIEETEVIEVVETMRYHGDTLHYIVTGTTEDNGSLMVFVPDDEEDKLTTINEDEIIPVESIRQSWQQTCTNCVFIKIVPAITDHNPLWEITYYDEAGRYVMDYVSMFDGSKYEEFRFKKMFD